MTDLNLHPHIDKTYAVEVQGTAHRHVIGYVLRQISHDGPQFGRQETWYTQTADGNDLPGGYLTRRDAGNRLLKIARIPLQDRSRLVKYRPAEVEDN